VQNKAAIAANATQHEIIQESAERQRQEEKAPKQLERVQAQTAELIFPTFKGIAHFSRAYDRAMFDCGVEEYVATYAMQWISPPTQPYVAVYNIGNPEVMRRVAANPFIHTLPPADLVRLAADPTRQARWTNLVLHTLLPPLRELSVIFASKVRHICSFHRPVRTLEPFADLGRRTGAQLHLKESVKADVLNAIFPGLGHDSSELLFGTTTNLFYLTANYATQWEAIATCWSEGDYTLLQPTEPSCLAQLLAVVSMMQQTVTAKELELCALRPAHSPLCATRRRFSSIRANAAVCPPFVGSV
jgi:hypothetical protein